MSAIRLPAMVAVSVLFLVVTGCGPTLYQPSGKITKGGAPLKISEKGVLEFALFAESDSAMAEPYSVTWEKDGSFNVTGRNGAGIPAGKYKTSIVLKDPYTADAKDVFAGKYARGKGPVVDVQGSSSQLVIDLPEGK
jgi:hypothetical protein